MTEQEVTINADYFGPGDGVYVIKNDGGTSCLGFDVTLDRLERYALDLFQNVEQVDELMARMKPQRGEMVVYDRMRELQSALIERSQATGEKPLADLTPQLIGLEGCRVEVEDKNGDGTTRRFIVGRSTGPIPCHLEISRTSAVGGYPARREYERVRIVEQVR